MSRFVLLPFVAFALACGGHRAPPWVAPVARARDTLPPAPAMTDALRLIRRHNPKLLGSVGYWLFDNLVLYASLAAFGSTPSFWVVAMAYLVGLLANSLPIPGGFLAVEGGLVGMLLLFDVRPASTAIAAVVVYRAISLWLPALIGSVAFLSLRREIGRPAVQSSPG